MASCHLVACSNLTLLRYADAHQLIDPGRQFITRITCEDFDFDNFTTLSMRYAQRGIFHLTCLLTEDGTQQFLFSRQFRLTLRSDLTNQDILRPHFSTDIDDAPLIEVTQSLFSNFGNIPCDLLGSQLGIASIHLVFLNMYRREVVFTHNAFTDENGVFVVATLPAHKGDQNILSECQFTTLCGRTVGNDLSSVDIVALAHYRSLVDSGSCIRTHKLAP